MVQPTLDKTLENLSRLASKQGVQSTLILSKLDGSIIYSTGLLAASSSVPSQDSSSNNMAIEDSTRNLTDRPDGSGVRYTENVEVTARSNSAEGVAKMVFAFVASAKSFTEEMDKSDEVKLLRLRTRKTEIVIVPDSKFLLVVIHDTPLA